MAEIEVKHYYRTSLPSTWVVGAYYVIEIGGKTSYYIVRADGTPMLINESEFNEKVDKVAGSSLVADTEIAKIHTQNTDTILDEGGANEVTAEDIRDFIDDAEHVSKWDNECLFIKYGFLYNWYAVTDVREITSAGWTIPTNAELTALTAYITSLGYQNGSALAGRFDLWNDGVMRNHADFGVTGFNLFPNGYRDSGGTFSGNKSFGIIWSLTESSGTNAYRVYVDSASTTTTQNTVSKKSGHGIRAIRAATLEEQALADFTEVDDYVGNDGQNYKAIKIDNIIITTENLIETKFRNGDGITEVTDNTAWGLLSTAGRCSYNNDEEYSFHENLNRICPKDDKIVNLEHISEYYVTSETTINDTSRISFWDTINGVWKRITWANIKATLKSYFDTLYAGISDYLKLDQTTPQTLINGIPKLETTRAYTGDLHELVDVKKLNESVTALNQRYYMTDDDSAIQEPVETDLYKFTCQTCPVGAFSNAYTSLADNDYMVGYISPDGASIPTLIAGIYQWNAFIAKTSGTKDLRVYWKLYKREISTGTETLLGTSATSDLITDKRFVQVPLLLTADVTVGAGFDVIGKLYATIGTSGSAPTATLYGGGTDNSHWAIPTNKEFLDTLFAPISHTNNLAKDTTTDEETLNFKYYAGTVRNDNVISSIVAGTEALTDDSTCYIEVDMTGTPAVTHNTTGFTEGNIPLYKVTTASGEMTAIEDKRTWLNADNSNDRQRKTQQTLSDGANISWNVANGQNAVVTLEGNRQLDNPTNVTAGDKLLLIVKQDGTGSRTLTLDSNFKTPAGISIELTATASAVDILEFYAESSSILHLINIISDTQ